MLGRKPVLKILEIETPVGTEKTPAQAEPVLFHGDVRAIFCEVGGVCPWVF